MDRQEWLEARRKGVGSTDAPAILGLSRYRTAIDVYEDKLGLRPATAQTAAMRWGLALEEAIARAYTEETGRRVRSIGGIRRAHHVRDFPMITSLDRLTYMSDEPVRDVELKTARSDDGFADKEGWRDVAPELRIPADYYVQVQHQMEVIDVEVADVAVLFGGSDFRVYEIPRDRQYGADLRTEEGDFWRTYIETGTYPPAGADDLANLSRRWSSTDDEKVATAEQAMLVETYLECVRGVDLAEQQRDEVRAKIEEAMATTGRLVAPAATVTWRSHDVTRRKWKEIAGAYRMLVDAVGEALTKAGLSTSIAIPTGVAGFVDASWTDPGELLDKIEALYSATSSDRPFLVKRAKETK